VTPNAAPQPMATVRKSFLLSIVEEKSEAAIINSEVMSRIRVATARNRLKSDIDMGKYIVSSQRRLKTTLTLEPCGVKVNSLMITVLPEALAIAVATALTIGQPNMLALFLVTSEL
jgi:hypothetical protein